MTSPVRRGGYLTADWAAKLAKSGTLVYAAAGASLETAAHFANAAAGVVVGKEIKHGNPIGFQQ